MSELLHVETTAAVAADDDAAALYALYRDRIREYCVGQLRDRQEAEDALQTTFLYAFTLLKRGTEPRRPLPWLYTIAHNVCRTRRRALQRRNRVESPVDLDTLHETIGRNDPQRDDVEQLETFLAALPATQRTALLLREWQGLSYAEIATRLELSESAVEAVLFRARRTLARQLRPVRERVASVVNGALLLPLLRRLAPAGSARTAATAVAVGTVAATALVPLRDSVEPARARPPTPRIVQTALPAAVQHVSSRRPRRGDAAPRQAAPPTPRPPAPTQLPSSHSTPVAPDVTPTPSIADAAPQPSAVAPPEVPLATPPPTPAPPVAAQQTVTNVQQAVTTVADSASNAVSSAVDAANGAVTDVQDAVSNATGQTLPTVTAPQPPDLSHILP